MVLDDVVESDNAPIAYKVSVIHKILPGSGVAVIGVDKQKVQLVATENLGHLLKRCPVARFPLNKRLSLRGLRVVFELLLIPNF